MLRLTLPLVPPPLRPEPAVTPVIVPDPAPGKVWPDAKEMIPVGAIERFVGVGVPEPDPNNRLKFADGLAPSAFTVCQRNV
jgi:hypothetical protein